MARVLNIAVCNVGLRHALATLKRSYNTAPCPLPFAHTCKKHICVIASAVEVPYSHHPEYHLIMWLIGAQPVSLQGSAGTIICEHGLGVASFK